MNNLANEIRKRYFLPYLALTGNMPELFMVIYGKLFGKNASLTVFETIFLSIKPQQNIFFYFKSIMPIFFHPYSVEFEK